MMKKIKDNSLSYKIINTRTKICSYQQDNTKVYHAEISFEINEDNEKTILFIHGTMYGGKYFVITDKSIFEYMDNSKPPVDIKAFEECRTKEDFCNSKYKDLYIAVDNMLIDLQKNN